jgi:DNA-directed RNA polymerase subunit K/omega
MNTKFLSRGPEIDTDLCTQIAGGRFDMVLIASMRAKEIARTNRDSERFEHLHPVVTALLELQEGKIGREYLNKLKKDQR